MQRPMKPENCACLGCAMEAPPLPSLISDHGIYFDGASDPIRVVLDVTVRRSLNAHGNTRVSNLVLTMLCLKFYIRSALAC